MKVTVDIGQVSKEHRKEAIDTRVSSFLNCLSGSQFADLEDILSSPDATAAFVGGVQWVLRAKEEANGTARAAISGVELEQISLSEGLARAFENAGIPAPEFRVKTPRKYVRKSKPAGAPPRKSGKGKP